MKGRKGTGNEKDLVSGRACVRRSEDRERTTILAGEKIPSSREDVSRGEQQFRPEGERVGKEKRGGALSFRERRQGGRRLRRVGDTISKPEAERRGGHVDFGHATQVGDEERVGGGVLEGEDESKGER